MQGIESSPLWQSMMTGWERTNERTKRVVGESGVVLLKV